MGLEKTKAPKIHHRLGRILAGRLAQLIHIAALWIFFLSKLLTLNISTVL